jgi:Glycosyltransferases involved in cell wall biogenesis
MKVSIIIPTLNEEKNIEKLLLHLNSIKNIDAHEIIIADGKSQDNTTRIAASLGAIVYQTNIQNRGTQMNRAVKKASGDIYYFLHADTLPPNSCVQDVINSVSNGSKIGCFRFRFDSQHPLLKINSYFTRFDKIWCRGGDQSLFVTKEFFKSMNGYDESCQIMEDFEFITRAKKLTQFSIIPKEVLVSARKYNHNGYFKVQIANLVAMRKFRKGEDSEEILITYRRMLNYRY